MKDVTRILIIAAICLGLGVAVGWKHGCPELPIRTYQDGLRDGRDLVYEYAMFLLKTSDQAQRDSAMEATCERFDELFKESPHE